MKSWLLGCNEPIQTSDGYPEDANEPMQTSDGYPEDAREREDDFFTPQISPPLVGLCSMGMGMGISISPKTGLVLQETCKIIKPLPKKDDEYDPPGSSFTWATSPDLSALANDTPSHNVAGCAA